MRSRIYLLPPLFLMLMAACSQKDSPPLSESTDASIADSAKAQITGTIAYRERIALSSGAVAEISLEDISRADAMATVIAELVENHRYEDVLAGFEITRVSYVSDLPDAPNRQLIEAVNTLGIPQTRDTYPGTTGIDVVRRISDPDGPNAARVTCIYSAKQNVSTYNQPVPITNDGQNVKQISSGTRELVTVLDRSSTPMTISPPAAFQGWDPYLSEAKFLVPAGEIVFERPETSVAAARARNFVGRLNSAAIGAYPEGFV